MYKKIGAIGLIVSMLLIGCGAKVQSKQSSSQAEGKEGGIREIHYFSSRSASDDTIVTLQEITDKYNEQGGKIKLVIDSNADRTSYDQKLRTMIAGGQMPDMFDLDATPYAAELGEKGMLTDMDAFLDEIGEKDSYIPLALDYGRTADGKLYTLPLELSTEMIWYNVDMFKDAGIEAPKTLDELLDDCKALNDKGYTAFGIGGGDGWPLLRLLATYPFRMTGNDFLNDLSTGKAKMSDEPGMKAAEFMSNIGKYFQPGFSTTDVATGLNLFLSGKSAMYPTGTWELNYFTDKNRPEGLNVDYFYMPTIKDAKTSTNDYWAFGGIGLSVNPKAFDEQYKDYLTFIVKNYSPAYFAHEHLAPQKVEMSDNSKFDPLFLKIMEDTNNIGTTAARPWDVVLNEDVIATINDNLPGLCMDEETPDEFVKAVDDALDANK
jgi:ABC superfamily ATP binding cassette transporter, binding protein